MSQYLRGRAAALAATVIALMFAGALTAAPASALPPAITITKTAPNSAGWNNTDVAVVLKFNQRVNATATLSGASTGDYGIEEGTSFGFTVSNEGTTKVEWNAANGAQQESSGDFTIKIDKTAPTVTPISPFDNGTYLRNTSYPISANCSDSGSGIATCQEENGRTGFLETSVGSKALTLSITDKAGNATRRVVYYSAIPKPGDDNTAPTLTLRGTARESTGWYVRTPDVKVVAADSESAITRTGGRFNETTDLVFENNEAQLPLDLPEGQWPFHAYAWDAANNYAELIDTIRIDRTDPFMQLTGVNDEERIPQGTERTVNFACNDIVSGIKSCVADVDGSPIANGGTLPTSQVKTSRITVTATDNAGRQAIHSRLYTVTAVPDSTVPTITSTVPDVKADATGWFRSVPTLTVSTTDPGTPASGVKEVRWRIAGDTTWNTIPVTSSGTAAVKITREGARDLQLMAVDNAGLEGVVSTYPYKLDATAPSAAITGVTEGADVRPSTGTAAAFSCTDAGSGVATCAATLDDVAIDNGTAIDSTVGAHVLRVVATDKSGLKTTVEVHFTVTAAVVTPPPGDGGVITPPPADNGGGTVPPPVTKATSKTTVSIKGRTVSIRVSEKSPASAKAKVLLTITKGKKTVKKITGTVSSAGKKSLKLPKLKKGTYKLTVKYSGNTAIAASRTTTKVKVK